jgi:hypothetical protein
MKTVIEELNGTDVLIRPLLELKSNAVIDFIVDNVGPVPFGIR